MTRYRIRHTTHYRYASDVSLSHQVLRVEPRTTSAQQVLEATAEITPRAADEMRGLDGFGNHQRTLMFDTAHRELMVDASSAVLLNPTLPPDPHRTPAWEDVVQACLYQPSEDALAAACFAYPSHFTPVDAALEAFARESFTPNRPVLDAAIHLNRRIFKTFKFDAEATTIDTRPAEVLAERRGVCQDFAHLMLAAMRALHLPVRYVSGYLLTRPPAGKEKLVGADASHAWVAIWIPGSGWVDLDPTNGLLPFDEHITLGWGLDYGDVAPVVGVVYGGGKQKLDVSVDVSVA